MSAPKEKYTFQRILSTDDLAKWYEQYVKIFPDEDDREPWDQLVDRIRDPERNAFHILSDSKGNIVGVNLINFGPEAAGAEYCPYGGLTAKLRGEGMYPQMTQISDQLMRDQSALYCLSDFEDPARVPDFTEVKGETAEIARKRINFFRREMKCFVVDDPEIPYVRPASSDDQEVQAYDLLGIRALNNQWDPVLKNLTDKVRASRKPEDRDKPIEIFNHPDPGQATGISKEVYTMLYMEMSRLQFGNLDEAAMRAKFPAVEQFMASAERSPKQWLNILTQDINPRSQNEHKADIAVKVATDVSILPKNHPVMTQGL